MRYTRLVLCCWACAAGSIGCQSAVGVRPPSQPTSGPGGSDYLHADVLSRRFGAGGDEYWIFQPQDPTPQSAPVVVFVHGWGGTDPRVYGAWIRHIVRKGHIVIYPRYQDRLSAPSIEMSDATRRTVTEALDRLRTDGPVRPLEDRIAWVGHSLGGNIAASLAATYASNGLPTPAALMAVEPGGDSRLPLADLSGMPVDALVLLIVGDADLIVADRGARTIFNGLSHLNSDNLDLITVRSDAYVGFSFQADHFAPLAIIAGFPSDEATTAGGESARARRGLLSRLHRDRTAQRNAPDVLDFFGYWKLLDGLLDAAFRGVNRDYALGDTERQRFMGIYSDGTPVTPLTVEVRDEPN